MYLNACEGSSLSPTVCHQRVPFLTPVRVQVDLNFLNATLRGEQYLYGIQNRRVRVIVREREYGTYCWKHIAIKKKMVLGD